MRVRGKLKSGTGFGRQNQEDKMEKKEEMRRNERMKGIKVKIDMLFWRQCQEDENEEMRRNERLEEIQVKTVMLIQRQSELVGTVLFIGGL